MANVSVYNIEGKEVETIELSDAVLVRILLRRLSTVELLLNPVLHDQFLSVSMVFFHHRKLQNVF